jgi:hypothetical protein
VLDADLEPHPGLVVDMALWLPVVLLLAVWATLRFATWQGPVLFSPADLQWLFTAPIDRPALIARRLRRALLLATVAGVVTGAALTVAATLLLGAPGLPVAGAACGAFTALAVLATALSWHVERSPRWSAIVGRTGLVVLTVAAAAALAAVAGLASVLSWSGPWGWATAPIVVAAGGSAPGWPIQVVLLGVTTVAGVVSALSTAGDVSDEALWRRAEAKSAASAAMFFGNLRAVAGVARRHGRGVGDRWRTAHVPRPSGGRWAVAWRDALALRRSPTMATWAALLVAGGFAAAVSIPERPLLALAAFVAFYAAASRLIEPIRLEADQPGAHWMLPWPWGELVVVHCIVPSAALTVLGWMGVGVVGIGGLIPVSAVASLLVLVPFVAAMLVTAAAIPGSRRPFPVETLLSGSDSGPLLLLTWLVTGPMVAAIASGLAVAALGGTVTGGVSDAVLGAAVVLAFATALIASVLWVRRPPE